MHGFPSMDYENIANHGVVDMWKLALAALRATNPPTSSFYRYFKDKDLCDVRKVFRAVPGPGPPYNGPKQMGMNILCSYDASKFWPEPVLENWCRTRPAQLSYFGQVQKDRWDKDGPWGEVVLCAKLFTGKVGLQLSLDGTDCSKLGEYARISWLNPGVSILHEFTTTSNRSSSTSSSTGMTSPSWTLSQILVTVPSTRRYSIEKAMKKGRRTTRTITDGSLLRQHYQKSVNQKEREVGRTLLSMKRGSHLKLRSR